MVRKGIEAGIIETFAEVTSGRDDDTFLCVGNCCEPRGDVAALLLALPSLHDSDRTWQWPAYCRRWLSARRRGKPRLFVFVDERNAYAENFSRCARFLD
jgi:hypothetical protein